jgi:hypothetical protein
MQEGHKWAKDFAMYLPSGQGVSSADVWRDLPVLHTLVQQYNSLLQGFTSLYKACATMRKHTA